MKYQTLSVLMLCLAIPILFQFAARHENQRFSPLSPTKVPAATDQSFVLYGQSATSVETLSGTEEGRDLILLGNKQINFWIP